MKIIGMGMVEMEGLGTTGMIKIGIMKCESLRPDVSYVVVITLLLNAHNEQIREKPQHNITFML